MATWIEVARPLPPGTAGRIASALRDRADLDVAVINAPGLLRGIGVAAAGELRHGAHRAKTE